MWRWSPPALAVAAAALVGACSGGGTPSQTTRPTDQAPPRLVPVTLVDTGCSPASFSLPAGLATFQVTNPRPGAKVTEMEVQDDAGHLVNDVEGVQAGHTRSFTVDLRAGRTYRVRCPETQRPGGTITVLP